MHFFSIYCSLAKDAASDTYYSRITEFLINTEVENLERPDRVILRLPHPPAPQTHKDKDSPLSEIAPKLFNRHSGSR
jgi:hypothetical protein